MKKRRRQGKRNPLPRDTEWFVIEALRHALNYVQAADADRAHPIGFRSPVLGHKTMQGLLKAAIKDAEKHEPSLRSLPSNPAGSGTIVYPHLERIVATKPDGQTYYHDFKKGPPVLGLPDGSLFIPARRGRLWRMLET